MSTPSAVTRSFPSHSIRLGLRLPRIPCAVRRPSAPTRPPRHMRSPTPMATPCRAPRLHAITRPTPTIARSILPNGQPMSVQIPKAATIDLRVPYIGLAGRVGSNTPPKEFRPTTLCRRTSKRDSAMASGRRLLHIFAFVGRAERPGSLLQRQQPAELRGGYGPSDFDRTHVFNIDYHYDTPEILPGDPGKAR